MSEKNIQKLITKRHIQPGDAQGKRSRVCSYGKKVTLVGVESEIIQVDPNYTWR